jgi:hypothetical protein
MPIDQADPEALPTADPRFLTLFVDASFCHRTHAAGYGAWASLPSPPPTPLSKSENAH